MSFRPLEWCAGLLAAGLVALTAAQPAGAAPASGNPVGFGPASGSSWLAGAVAGYDWQRGAVVFGLAADVSWIGLKSETTGRFSNPSPTFLLPSADTVARIDWYGTARARVGWAAGSFLLYGTGGLAYGNVSLNNTYDLGNLGKAFSVAPLASQTSGVRVGWVAGFGADYMLKRNLILSLEYHYVDLGTVSLPAMAAPAPLQAISSPSAGVHAQFQAVTIGLSYKFGAPTGPSAAYASAQVAPPPPPSDPWQGLFAGARTGGGWGNDLGVTTPRAFLPPE
jgi:outer membrane immunogenic protein